MNKVYVLMSEEVGWETEAYVEGVFSTMEKAKEHCEKIGKIETLLSYDCWVEIVEIDNPEAKKKGYSYENNSEACA